MISVQAVLNENGCLNEIYLEGHAGYAGKGGDIVCSAATALIRTAGRLLSGRTGVFLEDIQLEPGGLGFRIGRTENDLQEWLKGVSEFCLLGLRDLEDEFPDNLTVHLTRRKG